MIVFLLLLSMNARVSRAQDAGSSSEASDMTGLFTLYVEMPDGLEADIPLKFELDGESLQAFAAWTDDEIEIPTTMEDGKLSLYISLGHGEISCVLYRDEEPEFAGLCEGPAGQLASVLRRPNNVQAAQ